MESSCGHGNAHSDSIIAGNVSSCFTPGGQSNSAEVHILT
jgi:hypothetical protein